ncbi:hypothetical protein HDU81_007046 [Chytriomyces hyalinus]|nr:hypothetical protein HDU81_007046 [Chytriomyces hyalinus]
MENVTQSAIFQGSDLYSESEKRLVQTCYATVFRIQMAFGALAFLTTFYLIYFIVFVEIRARGTERSFRVIASPGNMLLIFFFLCLTGLQATAAWWNLDVQQTLPLLISSLFMSGTLTSYGWYAFIRGNQVLRLQMSERYYKICKMHLYFLPIASLMPPLSMLLPLTGAPSKIVFLLAAATSGGVTITLDMMFCYAFLCQILRLEETKIQVPREYHAISKYGLIASVAAVLDLGAFTMGFLPMSMGWITNIPLVIYYCVDCVLFSLFIMIMGMSLVLMKIAVVSPAMGRGHSATRAAAKFLETNSSTGQVSTRLMRGKGVNV